MIKETDETILVGELPEVTEPEPLSGETKTVIGIEEAEKLQKAGWILVKVKAIGDNTRLTKEKEYKFTKENK